MDYGMIGKIEKAKRYAQERNRIHFKKLMVSVEGENNAHQVGFDNGIWTCDCDFFHSRGRCSHTMALEMILEGMIPVDEPVEEPVQQA
jgi:hypothetical protein